MPASSSPAAVVPGWSADLEIMDFSGNVLHTGGLGVYDIGFGASADNCVSGCTLTAAINYDPAATIDDGSCVVCDNGRSVCTSSRTTSVRVGAPTTTTWSTRSR